MSERSKRSNGETSGRLNVLLVVSSYLPNLGGLQTVTSQLAAELQQRRHRVEVLAQRYPRTLPAAEVIDGVHVHRLLFLTPRLRDLSRGRIDLFLASLFYFPATVLRLWWRVARERPPVVNLHFVGAPAFFLLIARMLLRFRFVVSLHGDDVEGLPRGTWFDRWVFRATLRRADGVTACSRYLLDKAITAEPSIPDKAHVIYNGIQVDDAAADIAGDAILAAGRMMPKKGFDVLLRALVCNDGKQRTRVNLIGDGPERGVLEALTRELGLQEQVTFLGLQDHAFVVHAIQTCRMVVVPSREEPFGLVALEAMAAGKAVVATRAGGLPEVLDGADAVLVAPDSPDELAQAIHQTLARLEREPDYGKRNRELAARFSSARMVDQYEAVYAGRRAGEI